MRTLRKIYLHINFLFFNKNELNLTKDYISKMKDIQDIKYSIL